MKDRQRNPIVDELKGIAIILVVLGHIIQYVAFPDSFDENLFFRIIYSFHMPLFMCLSGYTLYLKKCNYSLRWIKKRVISLYVPFLTWSIIQSVFDNSNVFYENIIKKILYVENGLWFLVVLAEINLIVFIIEFLKKRTKVESDIMYVGTALFLMCLPIKECGVGLLKFHFVYFLIGFLTPKYIMHVRKVKLLCIMSVCFYCVLVLGWNRVEFPRFWEPCVAFVKLFDLKYTKALLLILYVFSEVYTKFIVPILGIVSACYIYTQIRHYSVEINSILGFLGRRTLVIYVLQWYFWARFPMLSIIQSASISFVLAIGGPLILGFLIRKSKLLSFLLFGILEDKGATDTTDTTDRVPVTIKKV